MSTAPVLTKKQKSVSSRREQPRKTSKSSTLSLIHRTEDGTLSQHDLDLLEKLRQKPDSEINFSDIPSTTVNTFANRSGILRLFKPYKLQLTLRLDADVIAWAKRDGAGYQSRINAALRKAMLQEMKNS